MSSAMMTANNDSLSTRGEPSRRRHHVAARFELLESHDGSEKPKGKLQSQEEVMPAIVSDWTMTAAQCSRKSHSRLIRSRVACPVVWRRRCPSLDLLLLQHAQRQLDRADIIDARFDGELESPLGSRPAWPPGIHTTRASLEFPVAGG